MEEEIYCKKCGHYYLKILDVTVWIKDHSGEAGANIELLCPECDHEFEIERGLYS